ncbi:hypothetical protein PO909_010630 [Leuciscus waleckii]
MSSITAQEEKNSRIQLIGYLMEKDKQGLVKYSKSNKEPNPERIQPKSIRNKAASSIEQKQIPKSEEDHDAILRVISSGDLHLLQELIKGLDVNSSRSSSDTLLHLAAEYGKEAVVYFLLRQGAKLNLKDTEGRTALHRASGRGHTAVALALVKAGADIHAKKKSLKNQTTVLHMKTAAVLLKAGAQVDSVIVDAAFELNRKSLLSLFLRYVQMSMSQNEMNSALFKAVRRNLDGVVAALIDHGADMNSLTQDGLTPLHLASQSGHSEVVAQLLEAKADLCIRDKQGRTALHWAAAQGEVGVIQLLLAAGADPNASEKEKKTPLHLAAMQGHTKAVSVLLAGKAKVGAKDMDGCSPLHYAARSGKERAAGVLLVSGKNMNVDDRNVWRRTPLHLAAEHGHELLVGLLLENGAKINSLDNNKDTPLHCACRDGHLETVQRLISWTNGERANLQATNKVKKTALQVAVLEDTPAHQNITTLLKKKMFLVK